MTDPRTEIVGRAYDTIADQFVEWQGLIEDESRDRWREELTSRLARGARVLELGCGAGLVDTRTLAGRFEVTGVDLSAEQVARARANVPRASIIHGDLTEVAFGPGSFDAVASFYVLNHVPRALLAGLFARIHEWLVPGGLLLATLGAGDLPDWTGAWLGATTFFSGFEPDVNRQLLTAAGFDLELDAVEPLHEPEGDVEFHWVLARRLDVAPGTRAP